MKIASTLQRTSSDFEQRKRLLARKEMDQAYKKNAKFTEASKNPLLAALENLLSGKAEKDLHDQDVEAKKQFIVEPFTQVEKVAQPEDKVIVHDQTNKIADGDRTGVKASIQMSLTNAPEETIQVLEKLQEAALAPTYPSQQDFRIAATANAQIQAVNGELLEEAEPPFEEESLDVVVPERFSSDVMREVDAPTVFGKELEKELFSRTFNQAKSTYSTHIAMVKNSYRSYNEPQFSMVV